MKNEIDYMKIALSQAEKAKNYDEVPIGAVIVCNGKIIAKGYNKRNQTKLAIDHAEIIAIKKACKKYNDWRLENCEMFVTLEPCPMCAGAIVNSRIKKVYFGAFDHSSYSHLFEQILSDKRLNHKCQFVGGILEKECSQILTDFFRKNKSEF